MKCALVGSRFFGATVFEALRKEPGVEFSCVVAPAADDRLALAALQDGLLAWQSACEQAGFDQAVPLGVVRAAWLQALELPKPKAP